MNPLSKQKKHQPAEVIKQYLTFCIGNEHYGLELSQTREIIEYSGITEVPLMPNFLRGVPGNEAWERCVRLRVSRGCRKSCAWI